MTCVSNSKSFKASGARARFAAALYLAHPVVGRLRPQAQVLRGAVRLEHRGGSKPDGVRLTTACG